MPRKPRKIAIEFDRLLAVDAELAAADAHWLASGYARSSARLWRCRDGSYTARLVWRDREAGITITYVTRRLVPA